MFSKSFLKDAVERAVKTAAQFAVVAFGADTVNVLNVDLLGVVGAAGAGLVISFLTSVASSRVGDTDTASLNK
jgi:hypothetical protein